MFTPSFIPILAAHVILRALTFPISVLLLRCYHTPCNKEELLGESTCLTRQTEHNSNISYASPDNSLWLNVKKAYAMPLRFKEFGLDCNIVNQLESYNNLENESIFFPFSFFVSLLWQLLYSDLESKNKKCLQTKHISE